MSELEKMIHNLLDEYMEMKVMSLICQQKEDMIEKKMKNLEKMLEVPGGSRMKPKDLDDMEITVSVSKYLELVLSKDDKPRFQKWNNKRRGFAE